MRWTPGGRSRNLEDRRGARGGMGGMGMKFGLGGTVVLLVLSLLTGQNFLGMLGGGGGGPTSGVAGGEVAAPVNDPAEETAVQFVSFVLDDAQQVWAQQLPRAFNERYRDARLVLFRQAVQSGCGNASAAMGPFYCPADERVYIDLGFFEELRRRFGAPGDFAQAYVLAHEVGHHVQHVLGTSARVREAEQRDPRNANQYSVRLELQADCFAGVWAASTSQRRLLEQGDVEEGLAAAAAVGDDRIQEMSGGGVNPEKFTHGSSQQRMQWFRRGMESGDPKSCDTFSS